MMAGGLPAGRGVGRTARSSEFGTSYEWPGGSCSKTPPATPGDSNVDVAAQRTKLPTTARRPKVLISRPGYQANRATPPLDRADGGLRAARGREEVVHGRPGLAACRPQGEEQRVHGRRKVHGLRVGEARCPGAVDLAEEIGVRPVLW